MRLFLIRHGQSESNAHWDQMLESSQMNAHLTALGRSQVDQLADWMREKVPQVDAIYTSSLHRALESAAPLEILYNLEAVVDHRIREGGYCYKTGAPIEDHLLPIHKLVNFHADPFTPFATHPPEVESYHDLRTRVGNFLGDLIQNHVNQTVVVINHGWVLNAFIDIVFNVGSQRSVYLYPENTSITYLEYIHPYRMGPWRAYFIAQTPHLDVFPNGMLTFNVEA